MKGQKIIKAFSGAVRVLVKTAVTMLAVVMLLRMGEEINGNELLTAFSERERICVTLTDIISETTLEAPNEEPVSATEAVSETTLSPPSGDDIRPVSEVHYVKTKTGYGDIYVKNGNSKHSIDIKEVLSQKPRCEIKTDGTYQVMIVHTHTSEGFSAEDRTWYSKKTAWRTQDKTKSVVALGKIIADKLNSEGIKTLHVTDFHDYPKYNGAYDRAKETIKKYLKKYPSIQMVIDVHRDSMTQKDGTKLKPTAVINGRKAAQVMIISGCNDTGKLDFPNWKYNLRMAVRLQKQLTEDWEGLARPLYFAPFRYNMNLTDNSLLLEFGTEANTLEEAKYTAEMTGSSLAEVLKEYIVKEKEEKQ